MRGDKIKAIQLRREGKSYRVIEKILGIPRSTLTGWFQKMQWSRKVKEKLSLIAQQQSRQRMKDLTDKINHERRKVYAFTKKTAENQYHTLRREPLFISGLMIYWGEGDRKLENGMIRVCNTDPAMLKLFHCFVRKYLPEISHLIKVYLVLYPDLNEKECKEYWSQNIEIPGEKFIKSTYIQGRSLTKKLEYGICTITISNRVYKEKINAWLHSIRSEVVNMRV